MPAFCSPSKPGRGPGVLRAASEPVPPTPAENIGRAQVTGQQAQPEPLPNGERPVVGDAVPVENAVDNRSTSVTGGVSFALGSRRARHPATWSPGRLEVAAARSRRRPSTPGQRRYPRGTTMTCPMVVRPPPRGWRPLIGAPGPQAAHRATVPSRAGSRSRRFSPFSPSISKTTSSFMGRRGRIGARATRRREGSDNDGCRPRAVRDSGPAGARRRRRGARRTGDCRRGRRAGTDRRHWSARPGPASSSR